MGLVNDWFCCSFNSFYIIHVSMGICHARILTVSHHQSEGGGIDDGTNTEKCEHSALRRGLSML